MKMQTTTTTREKKVDRPNELNEMYIVNEWGKKIAIELGVRHTNRTLSRARASAITKNHFVLVFKSHVMVPRCMRPSYLCKPLVYWPKLCTHHIHHGIYAHVCCCKTDQCILYTNFIQRNALPISSRKKNIELWSIPKTKVSTHTHTLHRKTFILIRYEFAFPSTFVFTMEREKKKFIHFIVESLLSIIS